VLVSTAIMEHLSRIPPMESWETSALQATSAHREAPSLFHVPLVGYQWVRSALGAGKERGARPSHGSLLGKDTEERNP
jgi:hypothetical protein